jgi:hypothetical protein
VGFEPIIPASERPQTHALDRAATGISSYWSTFTNNYVRGYICSYTRIIYVCVCVRVYTHTYTQVRTNMCMPMGLHTHFIYMCIYIFMYTCQTWFWNLVAFPEWPSNVTSIPKVTLVKLRQVSKEWTLIRLENLKPSQCYCASVLKFNALQSATLTDATEKYHMRFAFDIAAILGEKIDKPSNISHFLLSKRQTSNRQQKPDRLRWILNPYQYLIVSGTGNMHWQLTFRGLSTEIQKTKE